MNRTQFQMAMRVVLLAGVALCPSRQIEAQTSANLDAAIAGLTSPDVKTRVDSFSALFYPGRTSSSLYVAVRNMLRAHPAEAERIKAGMITALEMVKPYIQDLVKRNERCDEAFSDYHGDLVGAVASLRDPRALKGLLGAIDTGGMALNGLADLGPAAVDAVIEKLHDSDSQIRVSAIGALAESLTRLEMVRSSPEILPKARRAALAALDDPDKRVRQCASGLAFFLLADPEIRAKVESVASTDPDPGLAGERPFPVRVAAADVLSEKADEMFYVMRAPETRECRVQQASQRPLGVRFMGPYPSGVAVMRMCTHYDELGKEPSLCWSVQPENACTGW